MTQSATTMDEFKEFFDKLAELEDPAEFAKAMKESAPKAYQYIWNGGHKTAMSDAGEKIKTLEDQVKDFESKSKRLKRLAELEDQVETFAAERKKLETKIEELGKTQPDLSALQERHESVLLKKDESHAEELAQLQRQRDDWKKRYSTSNVDRTISGVVSELVAAGVDRDYALVQTSKPGFRERIRQNDDGDVTGALQKDGSTPFPLSDNQTVSMALARELLGDVPEKWREDKRQTGTDVGGPGGRPRKVTEEDLARMTDEEFEKVVAEQDQAAKQGKSVIVG